MLTDVLNYLWVVCDITLHPDRVTALRLKRSLMLRGRVLLSAVCASEEVSKQGGVWLLVRRQ